MFEATQYTEELLSEASSVLQSHREEQGSLWAAVKENSAITVRKAFLHAKSGDSGCLTTRYSMSTCCVKAARAATKDLHSKTFMKK